jgi:hypothetical protein
MRIRDEDESTPPENAPRTGCGGAPPEAAGEPRPWQSGVFTAEPSATPPENLDHTTLPRRNTQSPINLPRLSAPSPDAPSNRSRRPLCQSHRK